MGTHTVALFLLPCFFVFFCDFEYLVGLESYFQVISIGSRLYITHTNLNSRSLY